jgi:WD40 repeat protein
MNQICTKSLIAILLSIFGSQAIGAAASSCAMLSFEKLSAQAAYDEKSLQEIIVLLGSLSIAKGQIILSYVPELPLTVSQFMRHAYTLPSHVSLPHNNSLDNQENKPAQDNTPVKDCEEPLKALIPHLTPPHNTVKILTLNKLPCTLSITHGVSPDTQYYAFFYSPSGNNDDIIEIFNLEGNLVFELHLPKSSVHCLQWEPKRNPEKTAPARALCVTLKNGDMQVWKPDWDQARLLTAAAHFAQRSPLKTMFQNPRSYQRPFIPHRHVPAPAAAAAAAALATQQATKGSTQVT